MYHSHFNYKTSGTAILIRKGSYLNLPVLHWMQMVAMSLSWAHYVAHLQLSNVYGPNWDDPQFFKKNVHFLETLTVFFMHVFRWLETKSSSSLSLFVAVVNCFLYSCGLAHGGWRILLQSYFHFSHLLVILSLTILSQTTNYCLLFPIVNITS